MAANTLWGPIHSNNNVICAIDIRTGGPDPMRADLLEVCIVPVDHSFRVHSQFGMFHLKIRPSWKVDTKHARISADKFTEFQQSPFDASGAQDLFERWTQTALGLKKHKKIMPLVWNYEQTRPWLKLWLGDSGYDHFIHENVRDMMTLLNFVNDRYAFYGEEVPYKHPTFGQLTVRSGVSLIERNCLASNCKALIDVYNFMMRVYVPGGVSTRVVDTAGSQSD